MFRCDSSAADVMASHQIGTHTYYPVQCVHADIDHASVKHTLCGLRILLAIGHCAVLWLETSWL